MKRTKQIQEVIFDYFRADMNTILLRKKERTCFIHQVLYASLTKYFKTIEYSGGESCTGRFVTTQRTRTESHFDFPRRF